MALLLLMAGSQAAGGAVGIPPRSTLLMYNNIQFNRVICGSLISVRQRCDAMTRLMTTPIRPALQINTFTGVARSHITLSCHCSFVHMYVWRWQRCMQFKTIIMWPRRKKGNRQQKPFSVASSVRITRYTFCCIESSELWKILKP